MSRLLSGDDVVEIVEALLPGIDAFLRAFCKRHALAIVVLDPGEVEAVELYHLHYGDQFENRFAQIASNKAGTSHRLKCDTAVAIEQKAHCLQPGDAPYPGGVYVEGLVVACSGVEADYDQMFARWIAAACRARSHQRFVKEVTEPEHDSVPSAA